MRYHLHYIDSHGQVFCSVQMENIDEAEKMLKRHAGTKRNIFKIWEYLVGVEDTVMIYVDVI